MVLTVERGVAQGRRSHPLDGLIWGCVHYRLGLSVLIAARCVVMTATVGNSGQVLGRASRVTLRTLAVS